VQHTTDKSLRAVNIHNSRKHYFVYDLVSFYNNLKDL